MSSTGIKKTPAKLSERAWKLRLPESPRTLEDARLPEYRHPSEHLMLALALIALSALAAVAVWFREKDLLFAAAAIYLSMLLSSLQSLTYNRLEGAEVTATQFPAIHRILEELRSRFNAPATRVFVIHRFTFKADVLGLTAPYVIVLPSVLLDQLQLEDLCYVLGQALGHICFGHTRTALLLGGERSELPTFLSWIAWVRDLLFAGYWRAVVMSGDRAGILARGDVRKAIRSQLKISVGADQSSDVRPEDLIEQAYNVSQGLSRVQATLIRWQSSTPPLIPRLEAMVAWAGLPPERQT